MPGRTISIHAPREGGDHQITETLCRGVQFQSTPPARGATSCCLQCPFLRTYFNPRPPRGGRPWQVFKQNLHSQRFQSTPPARGATSGKPTLKIYDLVISIHAPREGGDVLQVAAVHLFKHFNPRPPRGGRRSASSGGAFVQAFQSTPPARGATPCIPPAAGSPGNFNPRPPRGGRRLHGAGLFGERGHFNPRPPRGGRRKTLPIVPAHPPFQSTPPARGATPFVLPLSLSAGFQSTPPARGATLVKFPRVAMKRFQSTPPARGATPSRLCAAPPPRFQSTPPARGATQRPSWWWQKFSIFQSTPPARGATLLVSCSPHGSCDFNPRPPRGGRPFILRLIICTSSISIHAPCEGGDAAEKIMQQSNGISIHAPREGGDKFGKLSRIIVEYFNPRPPRGGRQSRAPV